MNVLLKKLRIAAPHRFLHLQAPADFEGVLSEGTSGCSFSSDVSRPFDSLHWFVKTRADVDAGAAGILKILPPGVPAWVYFPKGKSGIQTDLTRDAGWEPILSNPEVRWINLIAFDDTWSAFSFRLKTEKDRAEEAKPKPEREIFQYADSATKTIRLPEDMQVVLENNPAEKAVFDVLSFSHKREYVEWIITAKQEKTRQSRLDGTMERLRRGWKNPVGR
ncbi:MAG: YdeI/OmpD-associated family protein [Saprospiraceae bacterium]|jgi:hypothetical protein|nr:YdeI/OmpD-associated family protein [Saprospiraceae bacterium]